MPNLYGILISLSIFCAILVARLLVKKDDEETLWGLAFWAIVSGIIGARLYHVANFLPYYFENPLRILAVWEGGLGIWGGVTGGFIGTAVYLKKREENLPYWLDIAAVAMPLGQAIGRWGNFFNQEIFGKPTSLPWGIYIKPENRPAAFLTFQKFHPLFLYESILDLILFGVLFILFKKFHEKTPRGVFMALYLGGYSTIRFFLEYLRINPWKVAGLNVSQCVSILVLSFSIVFVSIRTKK